MVVTDYHKRRTIGNVQNKGTMGFPTRGLCCTGKQSCESRSCDRMSTYWSGKEKKNVGQVPRNVTLLNTIIWCQSSTHIRCQRMGLSNPYISPEVPVGLNHPYVSHIPLLPCAADLGAALHKCVPGMRASLCPVKRCAPSNLCVWLRADWASCWHQGQWLVSGPAHTPSP